MNQSNKPAVNPFVPGGHKPGAINVGAGALPKPLTPDEREQLVAQEKMLKASIARTETGLHALGQVLDKMRTARDRWADAQFAEEKPAKGEAYRAMAEWMDAMVIEKQLTQGDLEQHLKGLEAQYTGLRQYKLSLGEL